MANPSIVIAGGLNEDAKNFSEALKRRKEKMNSEKGAVASDSESGAPKKPDSGY